MATESLKKFADELKTIRESRSLTLHQIAAKTKIDVKFLRAIEDADFDIMPDIYMRAFIKEYSAALNLDPLYVIKMYDEAKTNKFNQKSSIENETISSEVEKEAIEPVKKNSEESEKSTVKEYSSGEELKENINVSAQIKKITNTQLNFISGALVLVVIALIIYFAFINNSSTEIVKEESIQPQVTNMQRFETENENNPTDQNSKPVQKNKPDSLRLSISTSSNVWVKVSTDGNIVQQGTVQANSKLNYSSTKNFSVTVGNAGVVKILFNNKPVQNIGKAGEIRNIFITPDTIRYFTVAPKPKNENPTSKKN